MHIAVGGVWAMAVAGGMTTLAAYETRPGPAEVIPAAEPNAAASDRPTLWVFVHPHCPCTAATTRNLAEMLARCNPRPLVRVLAFQPGNRPDSWGDTDLVCDLRTIPGVTVEPDRDAEMAKKMGVRTSGQVLLFDRSGRLRFSGGITPSRGHSGENDGTETVVSLVNRSATAPEAPSETIAVTPVFGCGLYHCDNDARINR